MIFHFMGNEAQISGEHAIDLTDFGQAFEMPESLAHELLVGQGAVNGWGGSLPLLPAEQFAAFAFTQSELDALRAPSDRMTAPDPTQRKYVAAMKAVAEYRQEVASNV